MTSRMKSKTARRRKEVTNIDLKKWPEKALGEEAQTLPVALSQQGMSKISKEAGDLSIEIEDFKTQLRDEGAEKRAKIKTKTTRMLSLLRYQSTGMEDREVKVAFVPDFTAKRVYAVRKDTGDVIDSRPTTADEMQVKFGDDAPNLTGKARKISKNRGGAEAKAEGDVDDGRTDTTSDDAPAE